MVKTLKERINVNSEVQYTLIFQLRKILVSKKRPRQSEFMGSVKTQRATKSQLLYDRKWAQNGQ